MKRMLIILCCLLIFGCANDCFARIVLYQGEWKTGLVGLWLHDEGSGTAVDEPINNLDGVVTVVDTDPVWLSANTGIKPMSKNSATLGSGLTFNGTSKGYVTIADNNLLTLGNGSNDTPCTFSIWVKMSDFTTIRIIFGKYDESASGNGEEYYLSINSSKIYFAIYDDSVGVYFGRGAPCTSALYNGIWIHIVVTYDGSATLNGIKIYINGIQVDTTDAGTIVNYVTTENLITPFRIGLGTSAKTTFKYPFLGSLDEFIMWGRVLSTTEILQLYKQGTNAKAFENFNRLLITDGKLPIDMPLSQE